MKTKDLGRILNFINQDGKPIPPAIRALNKFYERIRHLSKLTLAQQVSLLKCFINYPLEEGSLEYLVFLTCMESILLTLPNPAKLESIDREETLLPLAKALIFFQGMNVLTLNNASQLARLPKTSLEAKLLITLSLLFDSTTRGGLLHTPKVVDRAFTLASCVTQENENILARYINQLPAAPQQPEDASPIDTHEDITTLLFILFHLRLSEKSSSCDHPLIKEIRELYTVHQDKADQALSLEEKFNLLLWFIESKEPDPSINIAFSIYLQHLFKDTSRWKHLMADTSTQDHLNQVVLKPLVIKLIRLHTHNILTQENLDALINHVNPMSLADAFHQFHQNGTLAENRETLLRRANPANYSVELFIEQNADIVGSSPTENLKQALFYLNEKQLLTPDNAKRLVSLPDRALEHRGIIQGLYNLWNQIPREIENTYLDCFIVNLLESTTEQGASSSSSFFAICNYNLDAIQQMLTLLDPNRVPTTSNLNAMIRYLSSEIPDIHSMIQKAFRGSKLESQKCSDFLSALIKNPSEIFSALIKEKPSTYLPNRGTHS